MGLAQKVLVADQVSQLVEASFDSIPLPSMIEAWTGLWPIRFSIYFDFAGYSNMAIPDSVSFSGFTLPRNFRFPYTKRCRSPNSGVAGICRSRPGCATTYTSRWVAATAAALCGRTAIVCDRIPSLRLMARRQLDLCALGRPGMECSWSLERIGAQPAPVCACPHALGLRAARGYGRLGTVPFA